MNEAHDLKFISFRVSKTENYLLLLLVFFLPFKIEKSKVF